MLIEQPTSGLFLPRSSRERSALAGREFRDWREGRRVGDAPGFFFSACKCCQTEAYMYTLGGISGASIPAGVVTADKSAMTTKTTSAVSSANLTANRCNTASFGNPGSAGYTTGGGAGSGSTFTTYSSTDKTTISNDTTAACGTTTLSQGRQESAALSERTSKAYVLGGGVYSGTTLVAQQTADVFTYSTETFSGTVSAKLTTAVKFPAGMNANSSKGYVAGGFKTTFTDVVVTAYKVTFSGDSTSAQASANLTVARLGSFGGSDGSTKGYFAGGQNGSPVSTIDKEAISTDTASAILATMARYEGSSGSDGTILLSLGGGTNAGIDGTGQYLTFASDSLSNFGSGSGNLSVSRFSMSGFSTVAL